MNEEKTNQSVNKTTAPEKAKRTNQDVNDVLLQGRLIHKYAADKATILTISTGRATPAPYYPKVVFMGASKDEANKYDVGTFVRVTGNIQSSKKNPNIKNQELVTVFGESIGPAQTQLEEDFSIPGVLSPSINHFKIAGTVTAIDIPAKNIVRLTVKCVKQGRISFVPLIHFSSEPATIVAAHLPGTFVRAYGNIQTSKVTKGAEVRHFRSFVATELK